MIRKTFVYSPSSEIAEAVRNYGIRAMSRDVGCSPGLLSRWVSQTTGLREELYDRIIAILNADRESLRPQVGRRHSNYVNAANQ